MGGNQLIKTYMEVAVRFLYILLRTEVGWEVVKSQKLCRHYGQ